jgi:hypothetical protein
LGVTNLPFTGITFPAIAIGLPARQKVISASAIILLAMLANYWESFGTGSLLPKIYLLQNLSLYPYQLGHTSTSTANLSNISRKNMPGSNGLNLEYSYPSAIRIHDT